MVTKRAIVIKAAPIQKRVTRNSLAVTQRYFVRPDELEVAIKALGVDGTPIDGYICAVYTCQQDADWKYCMGRCALGRYAGDNRIEPYLASAFVRRGLQSMTLR